ncbi:MAG: isocitrate lyase/phosphoenolpyruvate mutase family protein [Pseudomonadota bacterium]
MPDPTATSPSPGALFRALHDDFFVMPNPWDGASAKLLASQGFKALASSSAALAWTMARPDRSVTRDEAVAHAAMIAKTTGLPVNGDFESGYGDTPEGVAATIKASIDAGLAGCSIEDLPTHETGTLYDEATACRRLEAARNAIVQSGADFVLTGRCEAYLAGIPEPFEVVTARLKAFAPLSDVLYAPGVTDADELATLVALTDKPLNVIGGLGGVSDDLNALKALGVKRVSLGSNPAKVAYGALWAMANELYNGRVMPAAKGAGRAIADALKS